MGRGQVRDSRIIAPPGGRGEEKWRARLWAEWAARGPVLCFACGCPVLRGPSGWLGEIEHRISRERRPDLRYTAWWQGEPLLVPVHGSDHSSSGRGNRRCPVHDLACNTVIGANAARRDELGRSLPLTPAEIAAAQERTRSRSRSSTGRDRRHRPPPVIASERARARPDTSAGRAW